MFFARMHTGGKGVQAADAMGKALFLQKLQRAIGDRRLVAKTFGCKAVQHVIGPHGTVRLKQNFQHTAAHRRQPQPAPLSQGFGTGKGLVAAMAVVMAGKGQIGGLAGGAILAMQGRVTLGHRGALTCDNITYISARIPKAKPLHMRLFLSALMVCAATIAPAFSARAEVPHVVTDLPPVHALVAAVMGALGQPDLLADKGANAHNFQMRPSQAAGLQAADLVVWIGPEMTPWLERALQGIPAGAELRLLADPGTRLRHFAKDEQGDTHADEEPGHSHDGTDPHAWLDPENARHWLGLIATTLATQDPENAAIYTENANKAAAEIAAIDAEISALLATARNRPLVVYHDAYGYFADHYGLTIAATVAEGDAKAPGARHLAEIETLLATTPACLLPEVNHDPKPMAQLAETSTRPLGAPLDPEGSLLPPGAALYGQMLRALATAIAACAG